MAERVRRKPQHQFGARTAGQRIFHTLTQLQGRLDEWMEEYNEEDLIAHAPDFLRHYTLDKQHINY